MKHSPLRWVLLVIGIVIVGVVGIWAFRANTVESLPVQDELVIGWIGPLTGPSAVLGMDSSRAVELAVKQVNERGGVQGKPVKVLFEDDQYLPRKTVDAYQKLVQVDRADVIIAVTYGGVFAIADKAKEDGVIVIDSLDCNDRLAELGDHVFCVATESESIGKAIATDLIQKGIMKAGVLYSTKDEFMLLVAQALKKEYESKGGVVQEEAYIFDQADFRTPLLKLKAQEPKALVFLGHDELGIAMKQARELALEGQFYSLGTITSPGFQAASNGTAEGTLFAFWEPSTSGAREAFDTAYQPFTGRLPILALTAYPAYDSANLVLQAAASTDGSAKAIQRALYQVKDYQGISGVLTMNADGTARLLEVIYQLKAGKPVKQ